MSSVLIFSSDIKDATDLPSQLNYDIKELLKYISDNNKKYLILSLLKKNNYKIRINDINYEVAYIDDINFIINIFLRSYHDSINIYPKNLNIIHFIIFNKINMYDVLYFLIRLYYLEESAYIQQIDKHKITSWGINKNASYEFSDNKDLKYSKEYNDLIHNICSSYDDTNINISFNHNYTDLLFNGFTISNEISILTDNINNLQIQSNYNYNKINEDVILIKNNIINDVNQLNINNSKLITEITMLTEHNNQSQIQNNFYYNKIQILEDNTYILNKILLIIIIIYFLIILLIIIISTLLILNYNNIIDNEFNKVLNLLLYKSYIY